MRTWAAANLSAWLIIAAPVSYTHLDVYKRQVKSLMVGREITGGYYRTDWDMTYKDEKVLEVKDLSMANAFENVSFDLYKGEILAFCGLSDAGIHELGKALTGIEKSSKGSVMVVELSLIHIL